MDNKRYKVKLNSVEKIEELLQEIYNQSCNQINQIQLEMDKLQTRNLGAEGTTMDEISKYHKAMHDYVTDKEKAIKSKFEIAKFMGEVLKYGGNVDDALNDKNFGKQTSLDLSSLKSAMNPYLDDNNDFDSYTLKK